MQPHATSQGLVLPLPRDWDRVTLVLWLKHHGVRRFRLDVAGVPSALNLVIGVDLLRSLDTDVRLLVQPPIARVFPRPAGEVFGQADQPQVVINGKAATDPQQLQQWCAVWPSLETFLAQPGTFFSDERVDALGCDRSASPS